MFHGLGRYHSIKGNQPKGQVERGMHHEIEYEIPT